MADNMQKQKYQAYAAATQTVARTKQIVMLYDGLVRFMQQAKEAARDKRIEDRYKALIKSSEVIMGLQGCLDFEKAPEIARVLYSFYSSIDARIFSVHRTNSIETCDEVIAELKQMRDVWHEIDQNNVEDASEGSAPLAAAAPAPSEGASDQNITLSA